MVIRRLLQRFRAPARSPARVIHRTVEGPVYAIGDPHGSLDLYRDLEARIIADAKDRPGTPLLIVLGDLVDRGGDSGGLLDHLSASCPIERICLFGNHEEMMLSALESPSAMQFWLGVGGTETLASYGVYAERHPRHTDLLQAIAASVPDWHFDFLRGLPDIVVANGMVFCHAGCDAGVAPEEQDTHRLRWGDPAADDDNPDRNRPIVVHGHVPVPQVTVTARRVAVDTGAYATGVLSAVRLSGDNSPTIITASLADAPNRR